MKSVVINLSSKFENSISTRAAVENLFANLEADEVIVDFSDISQISSSASHQMILEIRALENKKVKVILKSTCEHVSRMLELAKTDRKNIFTVSVIKHSIVRSEGDLSKLLFEGV